MDIKVLTELVNKKIVKADTELTCKYKGISLDGRNVANEQVILSITTITHNVNEEKESFIFEGKSTVDGSLKQVNHTQIVEIDGMEPYRFARVYGISPKGDKIKEGKRRGRKPKNRVEED